MTVALVFFGVTFFWSGDSLMPGSSFLAPESSDAVASDTDTAGSDTSGSDASGAFSDIADSVSDRTAASRFPALDPENLSFSDMERLGAKPAASDGGACYRVAEGVLDGWYQKVHVLAVDPTSKAVTVRPVLSFDRLFGFETLKVMDVRLDAFASVNGGFGPPDGRPGGAVMINGVFLYPADSRFPSLILGDWGASLSPLRMGIVLKIDGREKAADFLNPWPMTAGIAVYTPAYGSTNRLDSDHLSVAISKGQVTEVKMGNSPDAIPSDGFLAVAVGTEQKRLLRNMFPAGAEASWETRTLPEIPAGTLHLMACGSLLVHDGKPVAPESDPWAGSLTAPAPRTAVGIGREGQLVFLVAEGRIKGGASGFTGKTLSRFLADMDLLEAALLDGGASSEIIVGHEIRNVLSAGRERKLPSGFVLVKK